MPTQKALEIRPGIAVPDCAIESIRTQIDQIDDALLALIEARLEKSLEARQMKDVQNSDRLLLRPAREQQVIDRLAGKSSRVSRTVVTEIWRELMGAALQKQRRTDLALYAVNRPVEITSAARNRFGSVASIIVVGSPRDALERARCHEAVAIIELSPLSSWWVGLSADPSLVIFDCVEEEEDRCVTALAVGRVEPASRDIFPILTDTAWARRIAAGDNVQVLAVCGHMRLCTIRRSAPGSSVPATSGR